MKALCVVLCILEKHSVHFCSPSCPSGIQDFGLGSGQGGLEQETEQAVLPFHRAASWAETLVATSLLWSQAMPRLPSLEAG